MAWRDPWENVDRANALRAQTDMQGVNMLSALQGAQHNALQMQQAQAAAADEAATRQAYSQSGGDLGKLREMLTQRGNYKQIQALDKADLDKRKAESGITKDRADAYKNIYELSKDQFGGVMQNPTPEAAVAALTRMGETLKGFGFNTDMSRDIQAVSQMNPEQIKQWAAGQALKADKLLPQFQTRNTGGATDTLAIDPVTGKVSVANSVKNTQSPDSVAATGVQYARLAEDKRHHGAVEANSAAALASGKAPAGYRFAADGTSLEVIPGGPADGKADKLGEGAKKQITGIDSLGSAIDDYVKDLGDWSRLKLANPNARAAMGTKYNNMMLQAKEAYNLGVLNGPDYQILQSVIADPTNPKNILLSPDAMAGQAKTLKDLMTKTRAAVKNQGRGDGGASGGWKDL